MAMTNKQKKTRLNRLNFIAYKTKLGDMMPIVSSKTLAAGDIDGETGATTLDMGFPVSAVLSVLILHDGAVVPAASIVVDGAEVTVAVDGLTDSLSADDVVTITAI